MDSTFYIIDQDGRLGRANITRLDNAGTLLKNIAREAPVVLRNFPDEGYHFKASSTDLILAKKLDSIKLTTHFAPITLPDGTARITPVFYDNGMSIEQSMDFTPPSGHEFWFFVRFDQLQQPKDEFLAWHILDDNIYRPPFSNTYEDGRICMGNTYQRSLHQGSIRAKFDAALEWFQGAKSNSDLRPDAPPIPFLLWDPTSMEQDNRGFASANTRNWLRPRSLSGYTFDGFFS